MDPCTAAAEIARLATNKVQHMIKESPEVLLLHLGMGQNQPTREPQVLVFGFIYQGSILGTHFGPTATCPSLVRVSAAKGSSLDPKSICGQNRA